MKRAGPTAGEKSGPTAGEKSGPTAGEKSGPTAGENKADPARDDELSTETARCFSSKQSPDHQFDSETLENKISHSTVQDVRGQDMSHLRHVTTTKKQTI